MKKHSLQKNFFTGLDVIYTMSGMKDEISIWENITKKRERKYYLAMVVREAYKIYTELLVSDKVIFV